VWDGLGEGKRLAFRRPLSLKTLLRGDCVEVDRVGPEWRRSRKRKEKVSQTKGDGAWALKTGVASLYTEKPGVRLLQKRT
jgi:hypothetical protein